MKHIQAENEVMRIRKAIQTVCDIPLDLVDSFCGMPRSQKLASLGVKLKEALLDISSSCPPRGRC